MQIIITGGAGFIGQRLASALLHSTLEFDELLLVDITRPPVPGTDKRVIARQLDLSAPHAVTSLISSRTRLVFHLAAIVSSHAEKEFDLGFRVNLDITRALLEACRLQGNATRFVFASSLAVYGGSLPRIVDDHTAVTPQSSYGIQKAIGELLVNDYARKKFIDGRVLRLPTICIRPGRPNLAASSFVSSILREPLSGEEAICPVSPDLGLWLASPDTTIQNLIHGAALAENAFGDWRTVNLPGIGVTVQEMLASLEKIAGIDVARRVRFQPDPGINRIVSGWPSAIDNTRALQMGFHRDECFDDFIHQYRREANLQPR